MLAIYVAVALSAFLAALLVYRYDLYNREPWYMLALAAGLGAATMRLVGGVELLTLGFAEGALAQAAVAAIEEELARVAVVGAIAAVFPRQFDDPMDGIIYGSIVGLGMGLEESFYLLHLLGEPQSATFPVELVRLCGHLVMGGIGGFGIGLARMLVPGWPRALGISLAFAVALHFSWDFVALGSPELGAVPLGLSLVMAAIILAGILVYGALVLLGSRLSRDVFDPSSRRSLWGWPFR